MSQKPVLVIMAAGMGSRYGGLKQIDPVDPYGNIIIDFSIFDAREAGFERSYSLSRRPLRTILRFILETASVNIWMWPMFTRSWIRFLRDTRCRRAG